MTAAELDREIAADDALLREAERLAEIRLTDAGHLLDAIEGGLFSGPDAPTAKALFAIWLAGHMADGSVPPFPRRAIRAELARQAEAELRAAQESRS